MIVTGQPGRQARVVSEQDCGPGARRYVTGQRNAALGHWASGCGLQNRPSKNGLTFNADLM